MITKIINHHAADTFSGKIKLSIDNKSYTSKPAGGEIGAIRNRLSGKAAAAVVDIQTLAIEQNNGKTIQGAILRDKKHEDEQGKDEQGKPVDNSTDNRFIMQQLFCVDIDNVTELRDESGNVVKDQSGHTIKVKSSQAIETPEQIQEIAAAAGLTPCYIAESFSSGKTDINGAIIQKYHVGFAAAEPVKDVKQSRRILVKLIDVFPNADEACKDPARMIFGTAQSKQVFYNSAVNSIEALLKCSQAEPEEAQKEPEQPQLPSSEPAPRTSRTQSAAPKAKSGVMSDFTRDLKENKTDPDRLLFMINPNNITFEQWRRVTGAYKQFDGGTIENWDTWNRQYTGSDNRKLKQDLKQYKGLGKGVDKMSLHAIAEEQNPEEYNNYMQELISLYKKPARASKKKEAGAGPDISADPAGEQVTSKEGLTPIEPPFERPAGYIDFAFYSNGKKIISPELLADNIRASTKYIFVKGADPTEPVRRFWYEHGVYIQYSDENIKNLIREQIKPFGIMLCKQRYINETFFHICIDNSNHTDADLNADENIINFKNGLLHLDTMKMTAHTPEFLSTVQLPFDYKPQLTLENAPIFDRFITHLANDDKDSKRSLIEYIGAVISNIDSSRFKKALFLRGEGNCGKSQYLKLFERLLTSVNYAAASLEYIESRFGAYTLYNKRLVADPDTKFMKVGELNTFKQATGGDAINIEPKGKTAFTYQYKGFLLFGCNRLPLFGGDRGKWVYNRMLLIECGAPVTEQERDPHLLDKLMQEREAIAAAAITALKTAISRKYVFTESEASKNLLKAYMIENDPVRQFIDECCIERTKETKRDYITTTALYKAYTIWSKNGGMPRIVSRNDFKKALLEIADTTDSNIIEVKYNGTWYYIWTLTQEAKKELGFYDSIQSTAKEYPEYL